MKMFPGWLHPALKTTTQSPQGKILRPTPPRCYRVSFAAEPSCSPTHSCVPIYYSININLYETVSMTSKAFNSLKPFIVFTLLSCIFCTNLLIGTLFVKPSPAWPRRSSCPTPAAWISPSTRKGAALTCSTWTLNALHVPCSVLVSLLGDKGINYFQGEHADRCEEHPEFHECKYRCHHGVHHCCRCWKSLQHHD